MNERPEPGSIVKLKRAWEDVWLYGILTGYVSGGEAVLALYSPDGRIRLTGAGIPYFHTEPLANITLALPPPVERGGNA